MTRAVTVKQKKLIIMVLTFINILSRHHRLPIAAAVVSVDAFPSAFRPSTSLSPARGPSFRPTSWLLGLTSSSFSSSKTSSLSSASLSTTSLSSSSIDAVDDDGAWSSSQTKRLPRIYVGCRPTQPPIATIISMSSSSEKSESSPPLPIRLSSNSIVPLTADQSHYLHVMRIQSVKRWGDQAGLVRIFNGIDGEWLARVVISNGSGPDGDDSWGDEVNISGASAPKRKRKNPERRKRRNNSSRNPDLDDGTILECVQQLFPQQEAHQELNISGGSAIDSFTTTNISVQLYIGQVKKQQLRWVVEKATELGVDGITILDTEFTSGSSSSSSSGGDWEYDKHVIQMIEAAEQCERLSIPSLSTDALSFVDLVSYMRDRTTSEHDDSHIDQNNKARHDLWLVCRERSPDSVPIIFALQKALAEVRVSSDQTEARKSMNSDLVVHILIGPEGGWSPNEVDVLSHFVTTSSSSLLDPIASTTSTNDSKRTKIQFVSLGSLVLRAETAAITAVAAAKMV